MTLLVNRKNINKKAQLVEELNRLIDEYDIIAISNIHKVRARQLQQLTQKLRTSVYMKVAKNNLISRTLYKNRKANLNKLAEHLRGSNVLLLTNMNPFMLSILLDKNKSKIKAKAGDIAPEDIVIPAGNTGLPPGPAISELHDVGIRTKIDMGSVWVINETTVVKKGEPILPKVATVLSKLGVKPLEASLKIIAAYDDGNIFIHDQLRPRIDEVKNQLGDGVSQAFNLAFNSLYPTPDTVKMFLRRASFHARNLSINSNYVAPEVIKDIVAKAYSHMYNLALSLIKINRDVVPTELI